MLIINEGFPVTILSNEITELEGESQVSYLLAKALKKQQELRAKFLEKGEKTYEETTRKKRFAVWMMLVFRIIWLLTCENNCTLIGWNNIKSSRSS